jgi:hypothetical protein
MLTAVRSSHKIIDVTVDDGFDSLSQLVTGSKAIDVQINEGFAGAEQDDNTKHRQKYYASLSGKINNELADKTDVSKLKDTNITSDTTIENFNDMLKEIRLDEKKNDYEYQNYKETMNNAMQTEDEVVQELLDYSQPVTINYMEAATYVTANGRDLFKKINIIEHGTMSKDKDKPPEDVFEDSDNFIEGLDDSQTAQSLYEKVVETSRRILDSYMYDPNNTYIDVKAAQGMYKALSFMGSLSREENYYVPMQIAGEVTNVNLKIYHTRTKAGKVAITLDNKRIGKIAAEFQADSNRVTGMIACESDKVKTELKALSEDMKEAFEGKKSKPQHSKVRLHRAR